MALIPFGTNDFESVSERLPRFRVRNLYAIENPVSEGGRSFVSRPSLSRLETLPVAVCKGFWQQQGVLSGETFAVYGTKLYSAYLPGAFVEIDDLPGTGYCRFAGVKDRMVVVRDGIAYGYDGTTLTPVVMPDDVLVGDVITINGFFLLSQIDSDKYFWIAPGETDPDALAFASAERTPDDIKAFGITSDEVWIIGERGCEVWAPSGDEDLPFQRIPGRVYNEGTDAPETAVSVTIQGAPALMWVTPERAVVVGQGAVRRVSNESVEERLKAATNLRAWSFRLNRKDFYVVTSGELTQVCDLSDFSWQVWDSYGLDFFRAHLGCQIGTRLYAGDAVTGDVWELENGVSDEEDAIVHEIAGFVPNTGAPMPCARLTLRGSIGTSSSYLTEALIELRWSDDLGQTFTEYFATAMGLKGEYSKEVSWRSLGKIRKPGRLFELRVTSPQRFRLDYVEMNDA